MMVKIPNPPHETPLKTNDLSMKNPTAGDFPFSKLSMLDPAALDHPKAKESSCSPDDGYPLVN